MHDSIQDDILNTQDIVEETYDGKFVLEPKEIVSLIVEIAQPRVEDVEDDRSNDIPY